MFSIKLLDLPEKQGLFPVNFKTIPYSSFKRKPTQERPKATRLRN
jgi:hypothetical protein